MENVLKVSGFLYIPSLILCLDYRKGTLISVESRLLEIENGNNANNYISYKTPTDLFYSYFIK